MEEAASAAWVADVTVSPPVASAGADAAVANVASWPGVGSVLLVGFEWWPN